MLGPKDSYLDILYHAIDSNDTGYGQKDKLPLRPSSSGECTRALTYKMMAYLGKGEYPVEKMEPRIKMLLSLGHAVEGHIKKWLWNAKEWYTSKYASQIVEFYQLDTTHCPEVGEVHIQGEIDDVYWSPIHKCIVDYKSKGDKFSRAFKSNWDETDAKLAKICTQFSPTGFYVEDLAQFLKDLKDPYFEANFLQLNGYANTGFIKRQNIDHAAIIQYNKNDSRMREVRFKPSEEVFLQVKAKFQMALDAAGQGKPELAPKDFLLGSTKCAYCPFNTQCYPELNEKQIQKEFFKTLHKKWPTDTNRMATELGSTVESLFESRSEALIQEEERKKIDDQIIEVLRENKIGKIRLDNGEVYELKYLKTPRPHYEVRRGKV